MSDTTGRWPASRFDHEFGSADWRIIRGRIEALFVATGFGPAAEFARVVATRADAAGHHPDIDIRYPGVVHVVLTTHAVDGLTRADAELATVISELAVEHGLRCEPVSSQLVEIAIDALDIDLVRPFWAAVLGYVDERAADSGDQIRAIVDPRRIGPSFWFQQMDEHRPQRNRVHIDIAVAPEAAEVRIAAALTAGGTMVSAQRARAFWVLADAEGNEACICTWQDRD